MRALDEADLFARTSDGKAINFEGCPRCCGGSTCDDCPLCGGLAVIPSKGNTGPGTFHVLNEGRCWCSQSISGDANLVHRDDVSPPYVMAMFAALNCPR